MQAQPTPAPPLHGSPDPNPPPSSPPPPSTPSPPPSAPGTPPRAPPAPPRPPLPPSAAVVVTALEVGTYVSDPTDLQPLADALGPEYAVRIAGHKVKLALQLAINSVSGLGCSDPEVQASLASLPGQLGINASAILTTCAVLTVAPTNSSDIGVSITNATETDSGDAAAKNAAGAAAPAPIATATDGEAGGRRRRGLAQTQDQLLAAAPPPSACDEAMGLNVTLRLGPSDDAPSVTERAQALLRSLLIERSACAASPLNTNGTIPTTTTTVVTISRLLEDGGGAEDACSALDAALAAAAVAATVVFSRDGSSTAAITGGVASANNPDCAVLPATPSILSHFITEELEAATVASAAPTDVTFHRDGSALAAADNVAPSPATEPPASGSVQVVHGMPVWAIVMVAAIGTFLIAGGCVGFFVIAGRRRRASQEASSGARTFPSENAFAPEIRVIRTSMPGGGGPEFTRLPFSESGAVPPSAALAAAAASSSGAAVGGGGGSSDAAHPPAAAASGGGGAHFAGGIPLAVSRSMRDRLASAPNAVLTPSARSGRSVRDMLIGSSPAGSRASSGTAQHVLLTSNPAFDTGADADGGDGGGADGAATGRGRWPSLSGAAAQAAAAAGPAGGGRAKSISTRWPSMTGAAAAAAAVAASPSPSPSPAARLKSASARWASVSGTPVAAAAASDAAAAAAAAAGRGSTSGRWPSLTGAAAAAAAAGGAVGSTSGRWPSLNGAAAAAAAAGGAVGGTSGRWRSLTSASGAPALPLPPRPAAARSWRAVVATAAAAAEEEAAAAAAAARGAPSATAPPPRLAFSTSGAAPTDVVDPAQVTTRVESVAPGEVAVERPPQNSPLPPRPSAPGPPPPPAEEARRASVLSQVLPNAIRRASALFTGGEPRAAAYQA
ncbi:hypothetical protein HYH03_011096 [Edaphochlamys debaryana]|uniref:Uncharacterized protein n=1 Tax=Edaphochlamys debaryana TaxID=47281 RepID=A0A836BVB4_9CHLO|nr:hypothetical protein HYH03_011096 [Edaphochlamys debaryana]|eukprot:KAG2490466.1 hypothetical protein HYH03_011096 [Edaphochlamys debaryana]